MEIFGTYIWPVLLMVFSGAVAAAIIQGWRSWRAETIPEGLRELATQYECANWIENNDTRVKRKGKLFDEMRSFVRNKKVARRRLLDGGHLGRYIALAAAILEHPKKHDADLILELDSASLPKGHAQYIFFNVVESLRSRRYLLSGGQRDKLVKWCKQMVELDSDLTHRLQRMEQY
jgi:hypothetical protein